MDDFGNILDDDGSFVYVSGQYFSEKIIDERHCFICGCSPHEANFNEEHIIPKWLLNHADLWATEITLSNGRRISYGRYKLNCCIKCNTLLGGFFERELADVFKSGASEVKRFAATPDGRKLIFIWLALLHLKTSIRDFDFAYNVDRREEQTAIGEFLNQKLLHHVYCLCRAFVNNIEIDDEVFGSLLIMEMEEAVLYKQEFDFADFHDPQTVMVRIGNVAVIACLNDSRGVEAVSGNHLDQIHAWGKPANEFQLMETFSWISCASAQMKKPKFQTLFDRDTGRARVICIKSREIEIEKYDPKIMGGFLLTLIRQYLPSLIIDGVTGVAAAQKIATGRVSFYSGGISKSREVALKVEEGMDEAIDEILLSNAKSSNL